LIVSGWKNGNFLLRRPVALGLRVRRKHAAQLFAKEWDSILIEMDGATVPVAITKTFWFMPRIEKFRHWGLDEKTRSRPLEKGKTFPDAADPIGSQSIQTRCGLAKANR
jgi:hypothetical protein